MMDTNDLKATSATEFKAVSGMRKQNVGSGSFRKHKQSDITKAAKIEFIYRDKFFCVINKPAGIPSQTSNDDKDILTLVSAVTNIPREKLFLVNRLDQPVSGLLIIAFSSRVHAAFDELRKNNAIHKIYLAVTNNVPAAVSGTCNNYLLRDGRSNKSSVVEAAVQGCKEAKLDWTRLDSKTDEQGQELALLAIRLITGRHHQIRVQLAYAGWPIYGDKKYGINQHLSQENIALLSYGLIFKHPVNRTELVLKLNMPDSYPFSLFTDKAVLEFICK